MGVQHYNSSPTKHQYTQFRENPSFKNFELQRTILFISSGDLRDASHRPVVRVNMFINQALLRFRSRRPGPSENQAMTNGAKQTGQIINNKAMEF